MAIMGTDPYTSALNQSLADALAQATAPVVKTSAVSGANMDASSLAALQQLIASLSAQQPASSAAQGQAAATATKGAVGYTKEAAFADAQGAMQAQLAESLRQLMPSIVRASEGAGTSQSSMRALLTQDAASRAAEGSAKLGLQAATDYGQIANQFLASLSNMNQVGDSATRNLLAALQVAKGAVDNKTTTETTGKGANTATAPGGTIGTYGGSFSSNPYSSFSF